MDKHRRGVAERVKENQNSLKKFESEQEDDFNHEVKSFQQDQTKQYRIKKDALKRVIERVLNTMKKTFFFLGNLKYIESIEK